MPRVNDGSKSSTLVNYLSDAWNWGAEMFCQCEVRFIKKAPDGEGYIIYFAWHGNQRGAFKKNIYEDLMWVHARKYVFLGAGSLGTTEILLRSKQMGLKMSDTVGTGMSGNGDILAFGFVFILYCRTIVLNHTLVTTQSTTSTPSAARSLHLNVQLDHASPV